MTEKHTPAPWVWEKNPLTAHSFNILFDGIRIAEVTSGFAVFSNPAHSSICPTFQGTNGEANARLIAAAPELLEFAIQAVQWFGEQADMDAGGFEHAIIETGRAAIAKAKGE